MPADIPTFVVTGVEQGVAALLGTKSTAELLKLVPHADLILITMALVVATSEMAALGRVSSLLRQVFYTIALNTVLSAVTMPQDPVLTCLNLLSVFFVGAAMQQEEPSLTAQYILVAQLTEAIQAFRGEALAMAWALAVVPASLGIASDLRNLAQLVTIETFMEFIKAHLPPETLLPGALLLLYMIAPFVEEFPPLKRMFRFAVFAVTNDRQAHSMPPWLVGAGLWGIWLIDTRKTSAGKTFAASAAANVMVVVILDAARTALDNDPALTLVSILLSLQIFSPDLDI